MSDFQITMYMFKRNVWKLHLSFCCKHQSPHYMRKEVTDYIEFCTAEFFFRALEPDSLCRQKHISVKVNVFIPLLGITIIA